MSTTGENFIGHLIELRKRLVNSLLALALAFACLAPFSNRLYTWLAEPMLAKLPAGAKMIATNVTTPFFVPIKVAAMAAFLVVLPFILYQGWRFIAPGLYLKEKRMVAPLIVASTVLFLCGMAAAYFGVFPLVFGYMVSSTPAGVTMMTDIENYLSFVLTMFLAFGTAFQVPVVMVILVRMGVVAPAKLASVRRYVIVGATVVGAIFMPPDAGSQILFATTLIVLYESGLLVSRLVKPRPVEAETETETKAEAEDEA